MTTDAPIQPGSPAFTAIFQQNWENVRSIKSERTWFMNTYSVISAGTLSLLQSIRGEAVVQLPLIFAMCAFSAMGLLISLRLKAELEECLQKVDCCVSAGAGVRSARGVGGRALRYPQFRWMFPVFYSFAVMLFVALFVYRISTLWQ